MEPGNGSWPSMAIHLTGVLRSAIPWSELAAKRPEAGSAWAIGLERRTAPAVGQQSWLPLSATKHPGASLGLLRFE